MADANIIVTLEVEEPGKPPRKMRVEAPASMNETIDLVEQIAFWAEDEYPRKDMEAEMCARVSHNLGRPLTEEEKQTLARYSAHRKA